MAKFIFPEIIMQQVLQKAITELKSDSVSFYEIFSSLQDDFLSDIYGERYVDNIWNWFSNSNIQVIQSWNWNTQKFPCISIQLKSDAENESQASVGDFLTSEFDDSGDKAGDVNLGTFSVQLDIGLHVQKGNGDNVLWLFYIVKLLLFKYKLVIESLGINLQSFSAVLMAIVK
jgi:hypothetical protein